MKAVCWPRASRGGWAAAMVLVAMSLSNGFSVQAGDTPPEHRTEGHSAASLSSGVWQVAESKYFWISFQNPEDLARLTSRLSRGQSKAVAQRIKKTGVVETGDLGIFDQLYLETMDLLGMRSAARLSIQIYPSYGALSSEYERLAQRRDAVIAFYNQRSNVICVDASADRRVLAHEMAHALADMIFVPNPPREVQELLAAYVQSRI